MNRVLVVEDNEDSNEMLAVFLRTNNFEVTSASAGQEGLYRYHEALHVKRPFSLIILDVALPDVDGFSVCKNIRNLEVFKESIPRTFIILVTAYDELVEQSHSLKDGVCYDHYVVKPPDAQKLLSTIRKLLEADHQIEAKE